tara:strand:- start:1172 stop:1834 length:663 start_codon:yes stop_codon:yes gene_type:complete
MNQNSYCGREYLDQLRKNNILIDVLSVGSFPEIMPLEDQRCGNLWKPEVTAELAKFHRFIPVQSLKDDSLLEVIKANNYDLALQGGTGIIPLTVINAFKFGILNFHPGDLPFYRGCSAPEWQIYEGNNVISTCHLVAEGIDTGEIIDKKILDINSDNYESFRSSIYPETAKFVVHVIKKYMHANGPYKRPVKQNENDAKYRKYIGNERIKELKSKFPLIL